MDKKDINAQAERYKKELMNFYGRRTDEVRAPEDEKPSQENEETADKPDDEEVFGVDEDEADDTAYFPYSEEENNDTSEGETEYNNRYPEPDLSGLDTDTGEHDAGDVSEPQYVTEESMGSTTGYILVYVRAGDESTPIEGATVLISAIVGGNRLILADGRTDSSGTTVKFAVPAPDTIHSQTPGQVIRPYSLYDVSVTAEGYFNARSVDVPVFAGITSVQNFSMIPLPMMMNSSDETVTYFNQEPDFGNAQQN